MIRSGCLALLLAATLSAEAAAQTMATTPPSAERAAAGGRQSGRARGADITRDEYIQRAVERARRSAETRFDRMDTNHDGVLTAEERRAGRAARRGGGAQ